MPNDAAIAILCGGDSPEKGISVNSARSLLDHLRPQCSRIEAVFFDYRNRPFRLDPTALYSNTPLDFEFKIATKGELLDRDSLGSLLRSCDFTFPAIHGRFGEGGELQAMLESFDVPFIGTGSEAAAVAFDKFSANQKMRSAGLPVTPSFLIDRRENSTEAVRQAAHHAMPLVVKPARSGSSCGVSVAHSVEDAIQHAHALFDTGLDSRVVVEPFCNGREFTIVVLQNAQGSPIALCPIEVTLNRAGQEIHDYRTKYLPSEDSSYRIPPRFSQAQIEKIRRGAQRVFELLGLRDLARLDGWLLSSGEAVFTDINLASGMEQNSFVFIQAAALGLSHGETLRLILESAAARRGRSLQFRGTPHRDRQAVDVLFGGDTAEGNVSVMSGTNVWLKLRYSCRYQPVPRFLDAQLRVWRLPYYMHLFHTVREITEYCEHAGEIESRLAGLRRSIRAELGLAALPDAEFAVAPPLSLEEFASQSSLVFIALHGGQGEGGGLQSLLERLGVPFTGSGSKASEICMDKLATAEFVEAANIPGLLSLPKYLLKPDEYRDQSGNWLELWNAITTSLAAHESVIVKPRADGCSTGVARLSAAQDLAVYLTAVRHHADRLERGELLAEQRIIELPSGENIDLLFEPFISTVRFSSVEQKLTWDPSHEWVELTNAVLFPAGKACVLPASITIADQNVLSLEEKFQGGTGVNITPPPAELIPEAIQASLKSKVSAWVTALGMRGFCRLDLFVNRVNGDVVVIEINSIPALTPSTVLFHQALAHTPPLLPTQVMEGILECATL